MISAIVLAAGLSTRMGERNKLLFDLNGRTIIHHVVSRIVDAAPDEVIVVLGHESELIKPALTGLNVLFVINKDYANGMTSSIQSGVGLATGTGYMICLSDMYALETGEYKELMDFFHIQEALDPECICLPVYEGSKGNPVIFSGAYRQRILSHQEPEGCRSIVAENQVHLRTLNMKLRHTLLDLDFPEDYRQLQNL